MSSFGLKSSIVNQKSFFPLLSFPVVYFWTGLCFPCFYYELMAALRHNPIQLYHFPDATHFKGNSTKNHWTVSTVLTDVFIACVVR